MWHCACDCGQFGVYKGTNLLSGHTRSCGCWYKEISQKGRCFTHGHTSRKNGATPEYMAWKNMHRRCDTPTNVAFDRYGGRGIKVCESWKDFSVFMADVGPRPSRTYSLHRINNDLGYNPSNVKWASKVEQDNNKGSNVMIEHEGKIQSLALWSREMGLKPQTIIGRIKRKWTVGKALTYPLQIQKRSTA